MPLLTTGAGGYPAIGGGGGDAAETTAFLARADAITTVGATERAAYKALINGLVTDGVFAKLDALYIFATDTSAHARLNLVQNAYNCTSAGAPTFTADLGYTGTGFNVDNIDTNFNPSTATTPKYTQNDAHYSIWSNTAGQEQIELYGNDGTLTHIFPNYGGPGTYMRINDSSASGLISSTPDGSGFYLASRTSSSNRDGYWGTGLPPINTLGNANSATSGAVTNGNLTIFFIAGQSFPSVKQITMASIGGALNSTDAGNFYSRLRTYMTAVGVP